ncbi:MAG: MBL fold metallo-hydrolase [Bacteroidales bacterium]|nr:MBL fold metallo-hydrolase [Bacteroidales bacterium]
MKTFQTPMGLLKVELLGHASVRFGIGDKVIYADPYSEVHDFRGETPADLILITHNHYDHYDRKAFSEIETPETTFVVSQNVGCVDGRYTVLANDEYCTWNGIGIAAVESYNVNRRNPEGELFHPRGVGNGYLLDFEGFKVYLAGDTEPIPEMQDLPRIDLAFLPKNLPYTMTDEEFIKAANLIKPKCLYAYHYFEIDVPALRARLDSGIALLND